MSLPLSLSPLFSILGPHHLPAARLRCSIKVAYQAADALLPGRAEQARRQAKQNLAGRSYPNQIRAAKVRIGRASPERAPFAPNVPDPWMELEKGSLRTGGDSIFQRVCKHESRGTLPPCIVPVRAWLHGHYLSGPVRAIGLETRPGFSSERALGMTSQSCSKFRRKCRRQSVSGHVPKAGFVAPNTNRLEKMGKPASQ